MTDPFGTMPDGTAVQAVTLRHGDMTARVLTMGAIVQDLRLAGVAHPLVLGCDDLAGYLGPGRYFGAVVGRVANRIGGAAFTLDGQRYATDANFRARHTLHGGRRGTDLHLWTIADLTPAQVRLTLTLPDGDMGFPGTLHITATITLHPRGLSVALQAQADRATPCNLTHHGYFDLDGAGDIRDHHLTIDADRYLPVDDDLIPAGPPAPVHGTPFDFTTARRIGDGAFDHNFCLSDAPRPLRAVARLTGRSGLSMQVLTTACGLQIYDGASLPPVTGLGGRAYGPHAGIALEAQGWPDAPNRPDFPSVILRPGQTYRETTCYLFD